MNDTSFTELGSESVVAEVLGFHPLVQPGLSCPSPRPFLIQAIKNKPGQGDFWRSLDLPSPRPGFIDGPSRSRCAVVTGWVV